MSSPPYFAKGASGVDAVAEFRAFVLQAGEPAAFLLAELADIHSNGAFADIPAADVKATAVRELCCRHVEGWVVFYAANKSPFYITILHVASLNPHAFSDLESEAERRLNRLKPGS